MTQTVVLRLVAIDATLELISGSNRDRSIVRQRWRRDLPPYLRTHISQYGKAYVEYDPGQDVWGDLVTEEDF